MKILVVDDSKIARKNVISKIPKDLNIEIIEAENGKEALSLYKSIRPNIVFLDLTMPEMDGYEALEEIMKFDKDAFVVIVSADIQPKAVQKVMSLGAKRHIPKNVNEIEISSIVLDYLKARE